VRGKSPSPVLNYGLGRQEESNKRSPINSKCVMGYYKETKKIREGKNPPQFKFNELKIEGNSSNKKALA